MSRVLLPPRVGRERGRPARRAQGVSTREILSRPPPLGWVHAEMNWSGRAADHLSSEMMFVSSSVGERIGRRRFIGRVAQGALAAGLGLSYLLWDTERASALPEICCGPHSLGCGPSEICPQSDHCNSSGGCKTANTAVKKRCNTSGT